MSALTLSAEQSAVFEAIEKTRENIFVTGRAGTGKSTLLNHLSWNTDKQVVICAPTGVAALNVGGQTIHSLFRLPIGVIADHDIDQTDELRRLLGHPPPLNHSALHEQGGAVGADECLIRGFVELAARP